MLDVIDQNIIQLIQCDARLSNAAIAKKVGLTTSSVHERIKKMGERGIIRGYAVLVNPEKLGKPIMAFVHVTVGASGVSYLESKNNFVKICDGEPDILECHTIAGEDCYILKARAASPVDLEKLIERIRCKASIIRTTTSIVLSTAKDVTCVVPA